MANKEIGTKIKLEGEREFNRQMTAINSGLKTTRSDMALLSAEFEDNTNSMEALTAKQKLLQSSVDQHKTKVEALSARYSDAAAKLGENDGLTQKYKQQLNQATVALLKEEKALRQTNEAIEKQTAAMSETSEAADAVTEAMDALDEQIKKDEKSAKKSGDAIEDMGKKADKSEGRVSKASEGLKKFAAASAKAVAASATFVGTAGVAAAAALTVFAKEAAETAKAAHEAGETLTESQQQWLEYSNQLDALDASVQGAKGALAGVLLPMLGELSTEGAAFLNDFTRDMNAAAGDTGKQTQVLSDYIVKGATLIKEKLPEYIESGKELFSGLAEGLGENRDELLDMGLDLVYDLLDGIIDHAPELAQAGITLVQKLTESLIERGPDLVTSAVGMVSEIVTGLAQAAPSLIPAAVQLVMQLITALVQNAPLLLEAGLELVFGIISGLLNGLGDIGNAADGIIDAFIERMLSSDSKILQLGGNIVQKIKKGIEEGWRDLVSWFNNLWDNLFDDRDVDVNVNKNGSSVDGSHASGLNYVPFDGYLAKLHRGEAVLTAAEAAAYRSGKSGQTNKVFNLTIHTQTLSKEELDMIVAYVNGKLGDDLP